MGTNCFGAIGELLWQLFPRKPSAYPVSLSEQHWWEQVGVFHWFQKDLDHPMPAPWDDLQGYKAGR